MKAIKHLLLLVLLLPALARAAGSDYVDYSGTITLGGTSQTLRAAVTNGGRTAITNLSAETEALCVNVTSAASCSAAGSWQIQPGETLTVDSDELITVVAATTGHKFTAKRVTSGFAWSGAGAGAAAAGGATAAKQDTGNTSVASIDSKMSTTTNVSTATLANVSASASNVTCLASNASRKRAVIFNDSATATLYIKPGATASTTSFTWQLPPGGTLTLDNLPVYTGILDCIWSAAVGAARVTEF